ncbi:hypothetical protein F5Y16DRAFT_281979 [Xylariaceae sp. FL0255]|nr:hypothetical protein F5Y16DRAFT_281979 [Xylariaceae sp. FL0255]
MPRTGYSTLVGLIDSDDEGFDVLVARDAPTHPAKKMPPTRKTRVGATATTIKNAAAGRKALTEKVNNVQEKTARGRGVKRSAPDEMDAHADSATENKPGNKTGRGRPKANKIQKLDEHEDELSEMQIETETAPAPAPAPVPAKRGRKPKATTTTVEQVVEIPETQQSAMEIGDTQEADIDVTALTEEAQDEQVITHERRVPSSIQRPQSFGRFNANQRPVSASDSELNDPSLRRRIGEWTRKYEALETRYSDLREIGVKEAERNFDRLKKQSEERAETDKQLIATLKAQVAAQAEVAKESERLKRQLEESLSQTQELQAKIDKLQTSLTEAKTETKTLTTKLAAARQAEATAVKVPGSAIKNNHGNKQIIAGAEAAAQLAQTKENLYGDLTGLLVCGVKRENGEEVFDCVQTGRNGTLHFKLAISTDASSDSIDDVQFMYLPQLDAARDAELIDTLPDYLVEEITFPRLHAAKFYSRVVKALSERFE